jgi:hypothetical protein
MNRVNRILLISIGLFLSAATAALSAQEPQGVADRLLEGLKTGKAPVESEAPPSWHRVAEEMTRISKQLPEPNASSDTLAAQENLIHQLTQLLERSKAGSAATTTSSAQAQGSAKQSTNAQRNPNRSSDDQNQGTTGQGPATKAGAAGNNSGENIASDKMQPEMLMRRAWGQLP